MSTDNNTVDENADDGSDNWEDWAKDRRSAVTLLRMEIDRIRKYKPDEKWRKIELPDDIWTVILEASIDGIHKGGGRRRPPISHVEQLKQNAVVAFGRKRKRELIQSGMKATGANSAEDRAATEASDLLGTRYGMNLSTNTIKRKMQSSDNEPEV
jgi:hypothetical protein